MRHDAQAISPTHGRVGGRKVVIVSRTDVHRPWRIQVADPYNRHIIRQYGEFKGEPLFTSHRNIGCGCPMCTDSYGRREARRRDRHQAKQRLRRGSWE